MRGRPLSWPAYRACQIMRETQKIFWKQLSFCNTWTKMQKDFMWKSAKAVNHKETKGTAWREPLRGDWRGSFNNGWGTLVPVAPRCSEWKAPLTNYVSRCSDTRISLPIQFCKEMGQHVFASGSELTPSCSHKSDLTLTCGIATLSLSSLSEETGLTSHSGSIDCISPCLYKCIAK